MSGVAGYFCRSNASRYASRYQTGYFQQCFSLGGWVAEAVLPAGSQIFDGFFGLDVDVPSPVLLSIAAEKCRKSVQIGHFLC